MHPPELKHYTKIYPYLLFITIFHAAVFLQEARFIRIILYTMSILTIDKGGILQNCPSNILFFYTRKKAIQSSLYSNLQVDWVYRDFRLIHGKSFT